MNPRQQMSTRRWLRIIKLSRGCIDCGYREDADGLQFDHVGSNKVFNVSQFSSRSVGDVRDEIAKCEVRCGTCHAKRSAAEGRKRNEQLPLPPNANDLGALIVDFIGLPNAGLLLQTLSGQGGASTRPSLGGKLLAQLFKGLRADSGRRDELITAITSRMNGSD